MSMFPRFAAGEFAPLFRLLDDFATHQVSRAALPAFPTSTIRSFQPRFDVRETKQGYELQGELPGINQQELAIEFTDAQTLSVSGRTERHIERGTRSPAISHSAEPARIANTSGDDSASADDATKYQKASVEDENAVPGTSSEVEHTPATSEAPSTEASPQDGQVSASRPAAELEQQQQQQQQPEASRYWVSERSTGSFHRTFNFPSRVDQENVKASLKNGILSIIVPKAQAPANRRILVE